jgi:CubicO group peptidase (beta-lactamase class C family)
MLKTRKETLVALAVLGIGAVPLAVVGLWGFMITTAKVLHPDPQGVPSAAEAAPPPQWHDAIDRGREIARAAVSEQNLPGLSVAVGIAGGVVWAEGFGWADLDKQVPVTPDTGFRIGTASVVLSSAAAGLLLEQGRVKLDDDIQRVVPEFPKKEWPVTLRQLMGHVAGVRNDGGDEGPLFSVQCDRPVEALAHFAGRPLLFEPGTAFRYSSYGWIVVSAAIEAAAGEPFLTFMRNKVFEPLGMQHTDADSQPMAHRATFYFPRFASEPRYGLHLMRPLNYSCYAGASAFVSTPSDLVRFGMAINGGKFLQPATVQELQTSQRLASGDETGYGLGWDLDTVDLADEPAQMAGHDGMSLGGMAASLMTFPQHDLVVFVVSNISYADTHKTALKVADAFARSFVAGSHVR